MPNYFEFLMRHGEAWIQHIVDDLERHEGVRAVGCLSLEERWSVLMDSVSSTRRIAA